MNRYIRADLHRILKRLPRAITLVLIFALIGYTSWSVKDAGEGISIRDLTDGINGFVTWIVFFFGLIEYSYVYGEDFKAKTMQLAIGTGIRRRHVVLAKWVEGAFLVLLDCVITLAILFGVAAIRGVSFAGGPMRDIMMYFFFEWVSVLAFYALTMPLVFATQATTGGMLIFIALKTGMISGILKAIFGLKALEPLNLGRFLLTYLVDIARSRAIAGSFSLVHIAVIVIYLVIGYVLTSILFKKKELEF